jgi:dTDP-4-amino-4,6-dideoxygalactose transaminase
MSDVALGMRTARAASLTAALSDQPAVPPQVTHAYYRFYAQVCPWRLKPGWNRDRVVAAITAEGVPCGPGGCPEIYRERAFDGPGRPPGPLPMAQWLGRNSFVLPVHPRLSAGDVADVAQAACKVLSQATS